MPARFGVEIDVNARGAVAEIDRIIAHVNQALSGLANSTKSPGVRSKQAQEIQVEAQSRIQQVGAQGGSFADVARGSQAVAAANADYEKAIKTNTKALREDAANARTRLASEGSKARQLETKARAITDEKKTKSSEELGQEKSDRAKKQAEALLIKEQNRAKNIDGIYELEVQAKALRAQTNRLQRDEVRALERRVRLEQEVASGRAPSLYQRFQAYTHQKGDPNTDRIASDFPRLGQSLAQRATGLAQYAISGAALYGVVNGLREGLKYAEDLQRVMVTIQAQFESVGDGSEFNGFRSAMLGISRETGVAADQVATVGFQMKGAFGDTAEAVRETDAAIKASVVTGIEQKELTDSLTGAALSYGVSIDEITDKAIGLEERFGVLARESLKVFGDMSATATQAGLSIEELGALIGAVQQRSALSGGAVAEGFNRILPAIHGSAEEILSLYSSVPKLQGSFQNVADAIGEGRSGDVLIQLVRDYDTLDRSTQNYITTLLGGRKEAKILNALFGDTNRVLHELDGNFDDSGKTARRFEDIQGTLTQTLSRIRQELLQIADSLARAGVFDVFVTMAGGVEVLVRSIGALVRGFAWFNDLLHGVPGRMLAVVVGMKAISAAITQIVNARKALMEIRAGEGALSILLGGGASAGALAGVPQVGSAALLSPVGGPSVTNSVVGVAARTGLWGGARAGLGSYLTGIGALGARGIPGMGAMGLPGGGTLGTSGAATGALTIGLAVADVAALQMALGSSRHLEGWGVGDRPLFAGVGALKKENAQAEGITRKSLTGKRLDALLDLDQSGIYGKARSGAWDNTQKGSRLESVGAFLTGNKTDYEVLQEQIKSETVSSFEEAMKNGILADSKSNKDLLKKLQDKGGGGKQGEEARKRLAKLGKDEAKQLRDVQNARNKNEDVLARGGGAEILDAKTASEQFSAGEISYDKYIEVLRRSRDALKAADNGDVEFHKKVVAARRAVVQAASQAANNAVQFATQMAQITGQQATVVLPTITAALQLPDLSPEAKGQLAQSFLQIQNTALQQQITNAPNAQTALQLGQQGVEIPPDVKAALEAYKKSLPAELQGLVTIPESITATADQLKQLRKNALQSTILEMQKNDRNDEDPLEIAHLQQRIAQKQKDAAETDEDRWQAEIALAQADRQTRDAERDSVDAKRELLQAQVEEDPIRTAQVAVEAADEQAKRAVGEAAKARALAARVRADRQIRDAVRALADSQVELLVAYAEASGNVIEAASLGVKQAQTAVDRAIEDAKAAGQDPDKSSKVNEAKAALVRAQANERDTNLNEQQRQIDVAMQLEKITTGQAIAQLEALLQIPGITQEETDNLLIKIKQLKDEVGRDFQFNVPANVGLPSLYEVRRTAGSSNELGLGSGYQDNRNYQVTLDINNGMDEASAKQFLADVFGTSGKVFGTSGRPY